MSADSNGLGEKGAVTRNVDVSRIEAGVFPFAMISPAVILIILVVGFPLLYSLYVSFTPYELLKPNSLNFTTARALRNYQRLLNDDIFWRSLLNTILFLAVTVNLSYVISMALSQLMSRVTVGQSLLRTLLMVPMMFAPILVGMQFRWFFNANVGLVNNFPDQCWIDSGAGANRLAGGCAAGHDHHHHRLSLDEHSGDDHHTLGGHPVSTDRDI